MNTDRFKEIIKDRVSPTFEESVYATILTAFFMFFSFIGHTRIEPGQIRGFEVVYFGAPLEWFKITANVGSWFSTLTKTEILWVGLIADIALFVLLSLLLVRVAARIADLKPFASKHK